MNITELETCCPECKSSLVDDIHNGERICSMCGIVVMEQLADYGPEAKSSSPEERTKLTRASGQTTFSQHDLVSQQRYPFPQRTFLEKQSTIKLQIRCTTFENGNNESESHLQEREDLQMFCQ